MKTKSILLVLLLACAAGRLSAQNLVLNGDFETGDLTGWTLSQPFGAAVMSGVSVHSGAYGLGLGSGTPMDLSQWLMTEVGVKYDISLWVAVDTVSVQENEFTASIGGINFLSLVDQPASAFMEARHSFIATSTSTLLNFNHTFADRFFFLDDVTVTAIPEPAAYVAFVGLAALGFAAWRRRRTSACSTPRR